MCAGSGRRGVVEVIVRDDVLGLDGGDLGRGGRAGPTLPVARCRATGPCGEPMVSGPIIGPYKFYAEYMTTSQVPQPPLESEDMLALDRQVCFALSVAARNVVAVYRPVLEPLGLTHPQYLVMLALWQHGQLSVKELSGLLQLDPGTLSPLLKRLEAAGLLRRERDPRDQRNLALALTDKGRALREQAEKIPAGIVERLGMPVEQLMNLHEVLTQVIAASQQALAHPAAGDQAGPEATVA